MAEEATKDTLSRSDEIHATSRFTGLATGEPFTEELQQDISQELHEIGVGEDEIIDSVVNAIEDEFKNNPSGEDGVIYFNNADFPDDMFEAVEDKTRKFGKDDYVKVTFGDRKGKDANSAYVTSNRPDLLSSG